MSESTAKRIEPSCSLNPAAWSEWIGDAYVELRNLAVLLMRRERASHTLSATALVSELYLRLGSRQLPRGRTRRQMFATCSTVMRRILVDAARASRLRFSTRAGDTPETHLSSPPKRPAPELLAVAEALERLARLDARQARVVELRFYWGYTELEIADILCISDRTVRTDWNFARNWLRVNLQSDRARP